MKHTSCPVLPYRFLKSILGIVLLVGILSSCGKEDYTKMIPSDAALVVSADLKQLAENTDGTASLKTTLPTAGNPLLKEILEHPEETGIDFGAEAYLYASLNRDDPTLLLPLQDAARFKSLLEKMQTQGVCEAIQHGNRFDWVAFPGQGLCAFTSDYSAWVYAPLTPPETILSRLGQLQGQDEKHAFSSTEAYRRMSEREGHAKFFLSLAALPDASSVSALLGIPFHISAEDLCLQGSIDFAPERTSLTADCYSENKELQDFLNKQGQEVHALSGKYFSYLPEELLACIALKLDGDGFSKTNGLPEVGSALTMLSRLSGIDAERFLDSFAGDFVMGMSRNNDTPMLPEITCYAETAGNGTKELLKEALTADDGFFGSMLKTYAPDRYRMELPDGAMLQLGVKESDFFLTTSASEPFHKPKKSILQSQFAISQSGKLLSYALIRPELLLGQLDIAREYAGENSSLLMGIRAMELAVRPGMKLELNLYHTTR